MDVFQLYAGFGKMPKQGVYDDQPIWLIQFMKMINEAQNNEKETQSKRKERVVNFTTPTAKRW